MKREWGEAAPIPEAAAQSRASSEMVLGAKALVKKDKYHLGSWCSDQTLGPFVPPRAELFLFALRHCKDALPNSGAGTLPLQPPTKCISDPGP